MINVQIAESLDPSLGQSLTGSPHASGRSTLVDALLEKVACKVLSDTGAGSNIDVTLVLTDDAQLRQLNRDFLGVDASTDVLAFPGGETDPDSGSLYLGDVIISYPRAQTQAAKAGHSIMDELQLLVVHGLLHLLGYDHADEESKATMWKTQQEILSRINSTEGTRSANQTDNSIEENESLS